MNNYGGGSNNAVTLGNGNDTIYVAIGVRQKREIESGDSDDQ
jgi:hypothetical protein